MRRIGMKITSVVMYNAKTDPELSLISLYNLVNFNFIWNIFSSLIAKYFYFNIVIFFNLF